SACKAEGTTCANAVTVPVPLGVTTLTGSTVGGGNHVGTNCHGSDGPDRIVALKMQANGFLTINLPRDKTSFDSVLYIATSCTDSGNNLPRVCADSFDPLNAAKLKGGEVISIEVMADEVYYVFVDGFAQSDSGTYTLNIDLSTGADCTDPVP